MQDHASPAGRTHRLLASDSRSALLDLLHGTGVSLSAAEAAAEIGLHPSTARLHLDLLASAGLVDRTTERRATVGRPVIRYSARPSEPTVPSANPDPGTTTDDYRRLAGVLADGLARSADPVRAAREAGHRWTDALDVAVPPDAALGPDQAVDRVVALMDDLGFAPERASGGDRDRIDLRRCPFESVAREHRAVVCGVHLGMLEETFERLGGAMAVEGLEPFASDRPLRCVVTLRERSATGRRSARRPRARATASRKGASS